MGDILFKWRVIVKRQKIAVHKFGSGMVMNPMEDVGPPKTVPYFTQINVFLKGQPETLAIIRHENKDSMSELCWAGIIVRAWQETWGWKFCKTMAMPMGTVFDGKLVHGLCDLLLQSNLTHMPELDCEYVMMSDNMPKGYSHKAMHQIKTALDKGQLYMPGPDGLMPVDKIKAAKDKYKGKFS